MKSPTGRISNLKNKLVEFEFLEHLRAPFCSDRGPHLQYRKEDFQFNKFTLKSPVKAAFYN